jgi:O-acetyl-ADP-ribose deacetylase (regulator of RNase III)
MKLAVYIGSLVDPAIGAHAVVNASNPSVALGSGVSGALREACGGAAFQQELRERLEEDFDAELEPSDCLVTSGGTSTAFRWVLHVPAVDYRKRDPETGGASGPRRVRSCVRAFLDAAASLAKENDLAGRLIVATPLLGAGAGGLGPVASLDAMMSAVHEHLRRWSPEERDALARLVFVVLRPEDARLVEAGAAKHGFTVERPAR